MSVQQQQALDCLYAIDNVLTIKITMRKVIGRRCGPRSQLVAGATSTGPAAPGSRGVRQRWSRYPERSLPPRATFIEVGGRAPALLTSAAVTCGDGFW